MKTFWSSVVGFSLALCLGTSSIHAQDLFVSQFDFAPMMTNPAQTGDYFGTLRIGGTYRDQGFAVTKSRFNTPSFYIDAPVFTGFKEKDWIGVGGYLIQDRAGAGQLVTGEFQFSGAYHLSLSKNAFRYVTLGLQMGTYSRSFRRSNNLRFGDGLGEGQQSTDLARAATEGRPRWSFSIGGMFRTKNEEGHEFRLGGKVGRLFRHDYSIFQRGGQGGSGQIGDDPGPGPGGNVSNPIGAGAGGAFTQIPLRFVGHAAYDIGLRDNII
ncbi:MAG: type IX secretion system membrane protein PorP/SprF, partial [Bacteroidetes bacterium]|nr:type IX secretion system membrane protein PorP/SprF [Bacteroidota bacterium]